MNWDNLDEEEKARHRKEQIEFRNKKRFSSTFTFFATVYEIVITFAVVIALFILLSLLVFKVFAGNENITRIAYEISTVVAFIGGMILGFFVFKKTIQLVIKKFNLEAKLTDEVLMHYKKKSKDELKEELKK